MHFLSTRDQNNGMMDCFDPYHAWLSISPREQPPHHYRLLGLDLFEGDAAVIEKAADRQRTYLHQHQNGPHGAASQQLLNEVTQAALCLLDSGDKGRYDIWLRSRLEKPRVATVLPPIAIAPLGPIVPSLVVEAQAIVVDQPAPSLFAIRPMRIARSTLRLGWLGLILLSVPGIGLVVLLAVYINAQGESDPRAVTKLSMNKTARKNPERASSPIATSEPDSSKSAPRIQPVAVQESTKEKPKDKLRSGETLAPGMGLFSQNSRHVLEFQPDGNLVLRRTDGPVRWASNTNGRASTCYMQNDGNLVLMDGANRPVWASNTSLRPGAELLLQNDGNAVIILNGVLVWATNTQE